MSRPKGARDLDHENKRRDLLARMTVSLVKRDGDRASLRELAAAAEVSVATLRHYFGDRRGVMDALLAEHLRRGRPGLDALRTPDLPFAPSIRAYAQALVDTLTADKTVRLGDIFALSLAEGLLDSRYGAPALDHMLEPTLQALEARLGAHIERGEMRPADPRAAALMLVSPLLMACLHQQRLGGDALRPLRLDALVAEATDAFVRAYAADRATVAPLPKPARAATA